MPVTAPAAARAASRVPPLGVTSGQLLIGGAWVEGARRFPVKHKVTGERIVEAAAASRDQVALAIAAARQSFDTAPLTPYDRYTILHRAAGLLSERRAAFAATIVAESGFTVSDAGGEIDRCIQTLLLSGEEAKRISGEMVPLDGAPGQSHRMGFTLRVPCGVVAAITPFNSPLNTVAHKVAPALAAGNTVVLKPASTTPLTAALLCQVLLDAGLPPAHINLVQGSGADIGAALTASSDVAFFTFTGSSEVGRELQQALGLRRASLELGSISSTIVCADADLERAVGLCLNASFRKAGQVCTSVQRLLVEQSVAGRFTEALVERARAAKVGDPWDSATLLGPMIDEREAERATSWVHEARSAGASVAVGGTRDGALMMPTIVLDARPDMRVVCREVFAPVISIATFYDFTAALHEVNDTPYGLAAGVFTTDLNRAMHAARALHMGTVHINETSSSRVDLMPYGGVKESGFGHEGPRYAIREMTEERLVTITLAPPRSRP